MADEITDPTDASLIGVLSSFMTSDTSPIGLVFPPRDDAPGLPDKGAREYALRRFCDFLSKLPFMRTMAGPPQKFVVPRSQIHINQPDAVVGAAGGVKLPTIAFLTSTDDQSSGEDPGWLGPALDIEGTEDVFAPDSALFYIGSHDEDLTLEVVSSKAATRRAIVEGIKQVLRSSDDSAALRLSLPDYFNQDATFTYLSSTYVEDQDAVRNRRKAHIVINLYVAEVMLANAMTLIPLLTVTTQAEVLDVSVVSP